jgi:hypothetical protein
VKVSGAPDRSGHRLRLGFFGAGVALLGGRRRPSSPGGQRRQVHALIAQAGAGPVVVRWTRVGPRTVVLAVVRPERSRSCSRPSATSARNGAAQVLHDVANGAGPSFVTYLGGPAHHQRLPGARDLRQVSDVLLGGLGASYRIR